MDKNTLETFQLLPLNNIENDPNQYFVVQDDGTLLTINRQIRYVTDIDESKQTAQPCTTDVHQQVYVDNSAELITLSDQFIRTDSVSNEYNDTFLLQPGTSSTVQQDCGIGEQKQESVMNIEASKQNTFAEITLNEDQCQLLEQRGWILLEYNDKVFVLNSMGLHDITNNQKLIQELKIETQNMSTAEIIPSCTKIENDSNSILLHDERNINLVNTNSNPHEIENSGDICFIIDKEDQTDEMQVELNDASVNYVISSGNDKNNPDGAIEINSLKIKTRLNFKDIPDKILLGKTRSGKNLYAKVKNCSKPIVIYEINADNDGNKITPDPDLNRNQFLSLVYNLNENVESKQIEEDLAAARPVIEEIFKLSNLKHYLVDQYLFITRITHNLDGVRSKSMPSLLTGVVDAADEGDWKFIYIPSIFVNILKDMINQDPEFVNSEISKTQISHVHIKEVKSVNNINRVSVTLTKEQLCFRSVDDKSYRSLLHACSSCAAVFSCERDLVVHQECSCVNIDQKLINAAAEGADKQYITIQNDDTEIFTCVQCNATFTKLFNCERHIRTHYFPEKQQNSENSCRTKQSKEEGGAGNIYKCTMCPGTFFHSSSYSKHIISQHIKLRLK